MSIVNVSDMKKLVKTVKIYLYCDHQNINANLQNINEGCKKKFTATCPKSEVNKN